MRTRGWRRRGPPGPARADLAWTQGSHQTATTLTGTVTPGGVVQRTVTATDDGPLSASLDWAGSFDSRAHSGSASLTSSWSTTLTATAPGLLSAWIFWWDDNLPNPDLDLFLLDGAGKVVASSTRLNPTPQNSYEQLEYTVASASRTSPRTFTLRVTSKTAASTSFDGGTNVPVTANLDLELWQGSTKLAATTYAHPWPPTVTARNGWTDRYPQEAAGLDVLADLDAAIAWANDIVTRIDGA